MWIKVDAELDSHPLIVKVGFWGTTVIQAVWRMCKKHGSRGVLSRHFWDAEYIAKTLTAMEYQDKIQEGMDAIVSAGMITIQEDGRIKIENWSKHQIDMTNRDRQQKHRDKQEPKKKNSNLPHY